MATYQISPSGQYQQFADLPTLNNGDVVQFERGGQYDRIDISSLSGVSIGAYGSGSDPIVGSSKTAELTSIGGGKWTFTDADLGSKLNILVLNGTPRRKGRFPKVVDEYYTIPSDSEEGFLNHGSLPFTASGEVAIRLQSFITNVYPVTSDAGGVISFTGGTGQYPPKEGYGFFLQNQDQCLTELGDWMYNASTKTVTIYLASDSPDNHVIQYPTEEESLTITDSDNLILSGLNFVGSNGDGVKITNSHHLGFLVSSVKYAAGMGVRLVGGNCDDITFNGLRVDHAFAGGFYADFNCDRVRAIDCEAYDIGMIAGGSAYQNYDGRSNGFCFEGGLNNLLQRCKSQRIGFNGFVYGGNGTQVIDCYTEEFGAVKSDCAGFYNYNGITEISKTGLKLLRNIAINGIGNAFGTPDPTPNCQGFYFDNGSSGISTDGEENLSAFNPTGLYIHNAFNCQLTGFVLFGNRRNLRMEQDSGQVIREITYTDNWHITKSINQQMAYVYGETDELAQFGTFTGNRYSNFKTGRPIFSTYDGSEPKPYRYDISPEKYFELVGETDYTLEDYEDLPYTITDQLDTINYQTTTPDDFGVINNISTSQDENGITITKSGESKTDAFLRLGQVVSDQWYLVSGEIEGDYSEMQNDFESNYVSPSSIILNAKIDSDVFALPLYSEINRATQQLYLLLEKDFGSATFKNITFSSIEVERTESLAELVINDDLTFGVYLDGVTPDPEPEPEPEIGENEIINLNTDITIVITLSTPIR